MFTDRAGHRPPVTPPIHYYRKETAEDEGEIPKKQPDFLKKRRSTYDPTGFKIPAEFKGKDTRSAGDKILIDIQGDGTEQDPSLLSLAEFYEDTSGRHPTDDRGDKLKYFPTESIEDFDERERRGYRNWDTDDEENYQETPSRARSSVHVERHNEQVAEAPPVSTTRSGAPYEIQSFAANGRPIDDDNGDQQPTATAAAGRRALQKAADIAIRRSVRKPPSGARPRVHGRTRPGSNNILFQDTTPVQKAHRGAAPINMDLFVQPRRIHRDPNNTRLELNTLHMPRLWKEVVPHHDKTKDGKSYRLMAPSSSGGHLCFFDNGKNSQVGVYKEIDPDTNMVDPNTTRCFAM